MAVVTSESGRKYRIGYDPATRILRVEYTDRAYETLATADEYAALMAAPSKGKWINANLKDRMIPAGGVVPKPDKQYIVGEHTCEVPIKLREPERPKVLQTFDAEDPCCRVPLSQAIESGRLDNAEAWWCPTCGCEHRPQMVGTIRHWAYREDCAIISL